MQVQLDKLCCLNAVPGIAMLLKVSAHTLQGLQWSSDPVDSHQFPKLRLKFKPNLVQLSGGMTSLPITDPQVGCSTEASCTAVPLLNHPQLSMTSHMGGTSLPSAAQPLRRKGRLCSHCDREFYCGAVQARAKPLQPREWQELLCASRLICPADSPTQQSSAAGATAVAPGQARGAAAGLKRSSGSRPGHDVDAAAAVADSMGVALGADQQQPVLLDLRNGYEWDAGHFQGAARPVEVSSL